MSGFARALRYNRAKPGDQAVVKYDDIADDELACAVLNTSGYRCSRDPRHSGQHVAEGNGKVLSVWPNTQAMGALNVALLVVAVAAATIGLILIYSAFIDAVFIR